ncbi:MAG: S-adenosyl-l-methionine hydroxide adenosyltransferase family protein [Leptolyngbyaceae cyanobacterium]
MKPAALALLTDFGLQDAYVGMMKGVIAQIDPTLLVIDLTHQIPPQNLMAARFTLMAAVPYFPPDSVYVAVVDPGVGTARRAIAVEFGFSQNRPVGFLVGPDNGLFSGVLSQYSPLTAVELNNSRYWRTLAPSSTFHGRDIFASVGAYLARGVPLHDLGSTIDLDSLTTLPIPPCCYLQSDNETTIQGCIQAIDHFGNLITTIPGTDVINKQWAVVLDDLTLPGQQTYNDRAPGDWVALVGSHGWIEVAINQGNAQAQLGVDWGKAIKVVVRG